MEDYAIGWRLEAFAKVIVAKAQATAAAQATYAAGQGPVPRFLLSFQHDIAWGAPSSAIAADRTQMPSRISRGAEICCMARY